jgi:hypothetical protein
VQMRSRGRLSQRASPPNRSYLSSSSIHIDSSCTTRSYIRGADKSLARPTSRCILFDGENISFDASLILCVSSTNITPITIINRMYATQNLLSL